MGDRVDRLEEARRQLGLPTMELWLRYFALGGMAPALELEAMLCRALEPSVADCDLLAVALNERFSELGGDHPLPYSEDPDE